MIYRFVVLSEGNRKKPHGVAVHVVGNEPIWATSNKFAETVFNTLFTRGDVFANVPQDNGVIARVTKTINDNDYLEYASVGVNLPLYITHKGQWDSDTTDIKEVLKYLESRFLEDDNEK